MKRIITPKHAKVVYKCNCFISILFVALSSLICAGCAGYIGLFPVTFKTDSQGRAAFGVGHLGLGVAPGVAAVDCSAMCLQKSEDGKLCVQYHGAAEKVCSKVLGEQK